MPVSRAFRADSSRTSRAAAGWEDAGRAVGPYVEKSRTATFPRQVDWLTLDVLLESRNDILAKLVGTANTDLVNDERMRWVAAQRAVGLDTDFVIDRTDLGEQFSFLALGDPGEGDVTQYAVAPYLLETRQPDTSFALIVSDVVYPTGENNDYADSFYRPYRNFDKPIYALPGNHDWYSLLTGFMWNFCGAEPLPTPTDRLTSYTWQERLARFLWLRPKQPERELLMSYRLDRWRVGRPPDAPPVPHQRGPYFAIKTKAVLLVCIDTGTSGTIDREQGDWLLRMAKLEEPKHKILLTGKPLWVDGKVHDCDIRWLPTFNPDKQYAARTGSPEPVETDDEPAPPPYPTVLSIVSRPEHNFIATIGGDVHNYQRFPIPVGDDDGRLVQHIVSGGGGAFMSPTHTIEDLGADEHRFRCYPLRRDSLARFAQVAARRFRTPLLRVFLASVVLWWLALQAWNPHNERLDDPFGGLLRRANVSPGTTVWEFAPLAWFFPGADYSWWAAVVIGALMLGVGVALLVLPWFRWRVKGVFALAAAGAALLCWHGTFMEVPGGGWTFVAVAIAAGLGIFLFSRDFARQRPVWLRLVATAALLVGAAITADLSFFDRGGWRLVPILLALSAAAVILIGGPRMSREVGALAGLSIGVLTLILALIPAGLGWTVIAGVALLLLLYAVYAFALLFRVVLPFDALDPETAARFLLDDPGAAVRPVDGEPVGRFVRAGRWGLLRTRCTWPLYPLEVVYPALFSHDEQPFFKNFLRVDVDGDRVKVYCFGVVEELARPTVEDHVHWDGSRWTEARAILAENGTAPVLGEVDWFPGGDLRFHLEAEHGARFAVLFSGADGWSPAGELEYRGPDSPCELRGPAAALPRKIGLRPASESEDAPLYAEGTFV